MSIKSLHLSIPNFGLPSAGLRLSLPSYSRAQAFFWLFIVVVGWTVGYEMTKVQMAEEASPRPFFLITLRFGLAGLILLFWARARNRSIRLPRRGWGWLAVQSTFLFILQYVGMYLAAQTLSSSMLAIMFSSTVLMNLPLAWLLLGQRPGPYLSLAGLLGFFGLLAILFPDLRASFSGVQMDGTYVIALGLAALGTLGLSLGTLAQAPVKSVFGDSPGLTTITTGWAMILASFALAGLALALGENVSLGGLSLTWWACLLGLALISSALPFLGYLILVERWGASTASLAMLAPPVLSLLLNAALDQGLVWEGLQYMGLAMLLFGKAMVLRA